MSGPKRAGSVACWQRSSLPGAGQYATGAVAKLPAVLDQIELIDLGEPVRILAQALQVIAGQRGYGGEDREAARPPQAGCATRPPAAARTGYRQPVTAGAVAPARKVNTRRLPWPRLSLSRYRRAWPESAIRPVRNS